MLTGSIKGSLTLCETSRTGTPSSWGVIDSAFYFILRCRVDSLVSVRAEKKFAYRKKIHSSVPFQAIDSIPSISCHKPKMVTSQLNYIRILNFMFEFPCFMCLYNIKNQQDVTLAILFISTCKITLHVSDASRVHHQE